MHIVHVVPAITIGGLWRLLQIEQGLKTKRFSFTVISIFDLDDVAALKNLDYNLIQLGQSVGSIDFQERISGLLLSVLRELRPDLVQSHHVYSDIYALHAAEAAQIKAIRTVHGITQATKTSPLRRHEVKTDWTDEEIYLQHQAEHSCAGTLTVSNELRQKLMGYGFDPRKIRVLYPGVDADQLTNQLSVRGSEGPEQLTIGFIGRFEMVKNPLLLPSIASRLKEHGLSPRFLVIGGGRQEQQLITTIEKHGLSSQFTLSPLTASVYPAYRKIDLMIIPSLSEGLPLVMLEAMACGIPVVASSVGGIPEVISHGRNGYLCPPNDLESFCAYIISLLETPYLRDAIGSAGSATVEQNFSARNHNGQLENLYRLVMRGDYIGEALDGF